MPARNPRPNHGGGGGGSKFNLPRIPLKGLFGKGNNGGGSRPTYGAPKPSYGAPKPSYGGGAARRGEVADENNRHSRGCSANEGELGGLVGVFLVLIGVLHQVVQCLAHHATVGCHERDLLGAAVGGAVGPAVASR